MKHLYIAADLIEEARLGTIGEDLFVGAMPGDVHTGVMLKDPLVGAELNSEMSGFVEHQFQVIVRDSDPEAAWVRAQSIAEALRVNQYQGDGVFIRQMYPLTLPVSYPKGDSDELETSVRIRVWFAITA